MTSKQSGACGSWNSPMRADAVVGEAVSRAEPRVDGDAVYWVEGRPREKGRSVVVRALGGDIGDVARAPFDVRSQVHSYGGGAYGGRAGTLYFVHFRDNQLYRRAPGGSPAKLTSSPACLFADICIDAGRNRLIAVREERPNGDVVNAINTLVAVDLATGPEPTLESRADFYASPAPTPHGPRLPRLTRPHPYTIPLLASAPRAIPWPYPTSAGQAGRDSHVSTPTLTNSGLLNVPSRPAPLSCSRRLSPCRARPGFRPTAAKPGPAFSIRRTIRNG